MIDDDDIEDQRQIIMSSFDGLENCFDRRTDLWRMALQLCLAGNRADALLLSSFPSLSLLSLSLFVVHVRSCSLSTYVPPPLAKPPPLPSLLKGDLVVCDDDRRSHLSRFSLFFIAYLVDFQLFLSLQNKDLIMMSKVAFAVVIAMIASSASAFAPASR